MSETRLWARGELHAGDVCRICDEAITASWPGRTVVLDLTQVTSWSAIAQATIVGMARELANQQMPLVLTGVSLGLRLQSRRTDVVHRVRALWD